MSETTIRVNQVFIIFDFDKEAAAFKIYIYADAIGRGRVGFE